MSPYRFILDTSAILAYDGSSSAIDVGELIAEAAAEHRTVGVPAICLAEAIRATRTAGGGRKQQQPDYLALLVGLANVSIAALVLETLESCRDFANWTDELGSRTDLAAAAVAAMSYADQDEPESVYVVTSEPARYGCAVPVIGIGDRS